MKVGSLRKINGYWQYRWYVNGKRKEKVLPLAVSQYPSKTSAWLSDEVQAIVRNLNPQQKSSCTMNQLIADYKVRDLPRRHSTRKGYLSYITNHIAPKWGEHLLEQVRPIEVKQWLEDLTLAPKSKSEIRNIMRILFNKARLYEYLPVQSQNPMSLVTVKGGRRRKRPAVISKEAFEQIMAHVPSHPWKVMLLANACLGIRASELMALKWGDCDFTTNKVHIQRGIVDGRVDETKTEASETKLPLHPKLANWLLQWRAQSEFNRDSDWIFASPATSGEKPYSYGTLLAYVKDAAGKAGLGKIGTHTLRHSYRSHMSQLGIPLDVQKDLMRHSKVDMTMRYGEAMEEVLRQANGKVAEMLTERIQ